MLHILVLPSAAFVHALKRAAFIYIFYCRRSECGLAEWLIPLDCGIGGLLSRSSPVIGALEHEPADEFELTFGVESG